MKKFALGFSLLFSLGVIAYAGPEIISSKEVKQVVPPPCSEWYRDTEWNVTMWGTYIGTAEDWRDDEYIEADHAWGGGLDIKYFFHRYFGVGIEGWLVDAERERFNGIEFIPIPKDGTLLIDVFDHEERLVGAIKGTFTIRYPFHCSRFAPYLWGGAGAIFGGGERDFIEHDLTAGNGQAGFLAAEHSESDVEFVGQIGAGLEVRITPHMGVINDFSWNFVARDNSDFGMVRAGLNFAF